MEKILMKLVVVSAGVLLSACNMYNQNPYSTRAMPRHMAYNHMQATEMQDNRRMMMAENGKTPNVVGGNVGSSMDSIDKSKLSHALDKPLGKSTNWANGNTGTNYTVVPMRKVTVNGNSFCRQYQVTVSHGEQQRNINGTACVGSDGQWRSVE